MRCLQEEFREEYLEQEPSSESLFENRKKFNITFKTLAWLFFPSACAVSRDEVQVNRTCIPTAARSIERAATAAEPKTNCV